MDFFTAANNVTGAKEIPDREEVEGLAWGVKRFLSMNHQLLPTLAFLDQYHFAVGNDRFYELMVYCMPGGRFRTKSVKKDEIPKPNMTDDLRFRVCRFFNIKSSEIPVLLQVVDLEALKTAFGVQPKTRRRSTKRKPKAKRKRKAKAKAKAKRKR